LIPEDDFPLICRASVETFTLQFSSVAAISHEPSAHPIPS